MALEAQVRVDVEVLTSLQFTNNHWPTLGYQLWGEPHSNALFAYMHEADLRAVAEHFAALADEAASRDIERQAEAA